MVMSTVRVIVQEVSSAARVPGAPIERKREEDLVAEIAISKATRRDSEKKKLMQSLDAEQAAHEPQGCRGEYEPPEQRHGAGARECEWRLQVDGRAGLAEGSGTLGKRPMVPEERERMLRKDELRRQMSDDVAQGLVVSADGKQPSRDKRDHRLETGRAEYRSWCVLCVAEERDRTSMILVVRFSMNHWTVICCGPCKLTSSL